MLKQCFKCGNEKPLTDFYKHSAMKDGRLGKCKECAKVDVRANRRTNQDYYREYDRKRGNRWKPGYEQGWRASNPEKYKAGYLVNNAVRDGKLRKEPCFMCGAEKVVGHHVDYSQPLAVIWLCQGCHKLIHAYEDRAAEIRGKDAA